MKLARDIHTRLFGPASWCRTAEIVVGFFFLGAALYKLRNYILIEDSHLLGHFQYWKDEGWVVSWLPMILDPILTYPGGEQALEILVILLQAIPGFLLVYGRGTRFAGLCMVLIQTIVYLGTYHHRHFNEFVGISIWIGFFFLLQGKRWKRDDWNFWWWQAVTLGLMYFVALYAWNRYWMGDAWLVNMPSMREHLGEYVVSSSVVWKEFVLDITSFYWVQVLWAGIWWLTVGLIPLLIWPKTARFAGAALLLLATFRSMTWLNVYESQGVLWVVVLFLWTTHAEYGWSVKASPVKKAWKGLRTQLPHLYRSALALEQRLTHGGPRKRKG